MKAERARITMQLRSDGKAESRRIIAEADRQKARILAEANEHARRLDGEGEAEAMRLYAREFGADLPFFKFIRTLEAYDRILDDKTTLFLPAESELLQMLQPSASAAQGLDPPPKAGPERRDGGRWCRRSAATVTREIAMTVSHEEVVRRTRVASTARPASRLARPRALGRCRLLCPADRSVSWHGLPSRRNGRASLGAPPGAPTPAWAWHALACALADRPGRRAQEHKRLEVGVGFTLPAAEQETVIGTELLTGDTNILSIALVLQYVIRDPADFLLHVEDARALIDGLGESVLTQVLAGMPVDEVLTTGRLAIQEDRK